jgi:hypothetical protein
MHRVEQLTPTVPDGPHPDPRVGAVAVSTRRGKPAR